MIREHLWLSAGAGSQARMRSHERAAANLVAVTSRKRLGGFAVCGACLAASLLLLSSTSMANEPPVVSAPASVTLYEDSTSPVSGISVSDADDDVLDVQVTCVNGTMSTTSFMGTPTEINAALATITATPDPDFFGPSLVQVFVSDGPTSVLVDIPTTVVAQPPIISLPPTPTVTEDETTPIPGIGLTHADQHISVEFSTEHGDVTPNWLAGDVSTVVSALAGIEFVPYDDFFGSTSIVVSVSDGLHVVSAELPITVTPDPPQISHPPTPVAAVEDTPLSIPIGLSPVDGHIVVSLYSEYFGMFPDFFSGDPATVLAELSAVEFVPYQDFSGPTTIQVHVQDGAHHVSKEFAVDVSIDPPNLSVPAELTLPPGVPSAVPGLEVDTIDGDYTELLLEVDVGSIEPFNANGSPDAIAAALASVTYTPPAGYTGPVSLTVYVFDGPHLVSEEILLTIEATPVPALGWPAILVWAALALGLGQRMLERRPIQSRAGHIEQSTSRDT